MFEYAKIPVEGEEKNARVQVWLADSSNRNEPSVRYQDGTSSGALTCYDDCQFVRANTTIRGKVVQSGRIRVTNDPLIFAIMSDAQAGLLSNR